MEKQKLCEIKGWENPYTDFCTSLDQKTKESSTNHHSVHYSPHPVITNNLKPFDRELTNGEIRTLIFEHAKKSAFSDSSKAKEIEILNVEYSFATIYRLETYNQRRKIEIKYERYGPSRLDDTSMGVIPTIWEMNPVYVPKLLEKYKEAQKVPHSEYIGRCHECGGSGTTTETYTTTDSNNQTTTHTRTVTCSSCGGNGKLKYYQQLIIKWIPKVYNFISNHSQVSKKKLLQCNRQTIFEDAKEHVLAVEYPSDNNITKASLNLIEKHSATFSGNERSVWQEQRIDLVPLSAVHYKSKNTIKTFWIYSDELQVVAPQFPKKICNVM